MRSCKLLLEEKLAFPVQDINHFKAIRCETLIYNEIIAAIILFLISQKARNFSTTYEPCEKWELLVLVSDSPVKS